MGLFRDFRQATRNLAEPTLSVAELPPVAMPATSAGTLYELADLGRVGDGAREYAALLATNNSTDFIELVDCHNSRQRIHPGQTFEWTKPRGCQWLAVTPNATTTAGQVTLTPKVRFRA